MGWYFNLDSFIIRNINNYYKGKTHLLKKNQELWKQKEENKNIHNPTIYKQPCLYKPWFKFFQALFFFFFWLYHSRLKKIHLGTYKMYYVINNYFLVYFNRVIVCHKQLSKFDLFYFSKQMNNILYYGNTIN